MKKNTLIRKILCRIYRGLTTVIIICGLFFMGLYLAGIRPYVVQSGSMEPAIVTGSVCFVNQNAAFDNITAGDIIAFKVSEDTLVTHRVAAVGNNGIVTKGDANDTEDAVLVTEENYIGKTIFSIPKAGYVLNFAHTKAGIAVLTAAALVLLFAGGLLEEKEKGESHEEAGAEKPSK